MLPKRGSELFAEMRLACTFWPYDVDVTLHHQELEDGFEAFVSGLGFEQFDFAVWSLEFDPTRQHFLSHLLGREHSDLSDLVGDVLAEFDRGDLLAHKVFEDRTQV